jgi:brefeldin A-resistance guanine nucleotide exchange factor 1
MDAETVRKSKQRKGWLAQAAEAFSRSPDEAFELLQGCGYWAGPPDAAMVGSFLRNTPGLDKKKVGEYLGKNKPFVLEVLEAYVATFEFKSAKFNDAVRTFMQSFRLPPEAQMISRILESFAKHYYESNLDAGLYPDPDAVFLMTFAAIMLHSDHYNDNVKNKMTKAEYFKNCHGIPGLKELPNEVLDEIFQDITSQEIKIPDEFPGGEITNTRWKDLLSRGLLVGSFVSGFNGIFDKEIFSIIKSPVIAAISVGVLPKNTKNTLFFLTLELLIPSNLFFPFFFFSSLSLYFFLSLLSSAAASL